MVPGSEGTLSLLRTPIVRTPDRCSMRGLLSWQPHSPSPAPCAPRCWKNDIPVFCPGLTDGSVGDMIYSHSYKCARPP